MKNSDEEYVDISIPNVIVDKIKDHIKGTEFNSVSDYIVFILKEVLEDKSNESLSADDEEEVKRRLKSLGYL
jgi:Arc/MetJ-type ribon-helix-helix transcriptional regulator